MKRTWIGMLLIGLGAGVFVGTLALLGLRLLFPPGESRPAARVGSVAPDFVLTDLAGNQVTLSQFRGKAVMINFWATWCPPCREEMPDIQAAASQYSDQLVVLGVNDAESQSQVGSFVREFGLTFPVLLDGTSQVNRLYQVRGLPSSFFIDPDGVVQAVHVGLLNPGDLIAGLATIGVGDE